MLSMVNSGHKANTDATLVSLFGFLLWVIVHPVFLEVGFESCTQIVQIVSCLGPVSFFKKIPLVCFN